MYRVSLYRTFAVGCIGLAFAGSVAAAVALSSTADAARRRKETKNLVVTLVTPTLNQEVLPDLSDPGLNHVVTVRFSSSPRKKDVIDRQNVFNRLTSKVEFFDTTFSRLAGTPRLRRNVLVFDPRTPENRGLLPRGQYTLNIKRSVRNRRGRLLNSGVRDFTTTFSVGTDVHRPVLRRISPIDGQSNVGLNRRVVATFTEPMDPATALHNMLVQDASTNPPTAVAGLGGGTGVTLERGGFDMVFTPDPCFGYPPRTTIQCFILGEDMIDVDAQGNCIPLANPTFTGVTDVFGNGFRQDPGLQWQVDPILACVWNSPNGRYDQFTGVFRMQFVSKGVKPRPQGLVPGSPMFTGMPTATPCAVQAFFSPSCFAAGRVIFYGTSNGLGEINLTNFVNRFNQGVTDLRLVNTLANAPARLGRGGGMVVDPRWDPTPAGNRHTFLYYVNRRTGTVDVLDSRNLKRLGRFSGFSSPRDVTISTDFAQARTTLFVTDFGSNQLVGIDLNGIAVNFGGRPGAPSPCETLQDRQSSRIFIETGRGPTGVAADSFLLSRVMTANTLDNSVTLANVRTGKVIRDMAVGSTPVDCDWSLLALGQVSVSMIANQGGPTDPNGSVSMYIQSPPLLGGGFPGAAQTRDAVEAIFTEGVKNPVAVWGNQQWLSPLTGNSVPVEWWVPNTGGKTVSNLALSLAGLFGVSVAPQSLGDYEVGLNPRGVVRDPFYPNAFVFASVSGSGELAGFDPLRGIPATRVRVPGVGRLFTCFTH